MKTTILLTIDHNKPIPDLVDLVADRAWRIDGVNIGPGSEGVVAKLVAEPAEGVHVMDARDLSEIADQLRQAAALSSDGSGKLMFSAGALANILERACAGRLRVVWPAEQQ